MKRSWIMVFALTVGVVLNFVIPAFQNPDEPVHFGAVLRVSLGGPRNSATEKEIIRLMDRNQWWRFVGMGRPAKFPGKLGEIPYLMGGISGKDSYAGIRGLYAYHFLAGNALRLAGVTGVEASYYFLRLLSFLLFLAALGFLGAGFGRLSRSADSAFATAVFLVLLVPQFLVTSIAVNPDMLCVFLGGAFFYAAIAILEGQPSVSHYVLAFFTGAAGFLTDKSAFILFPLALLLIVFLISRENAKAILVLILVLALVFVLLAYGLTLLFPLQVENSFQIIRASFASHAGKIKGLFVWDAFNRDFTALLTDSFFLKFGGMAFGAGREIVLAWRALVAVAGAGFVFFFVMLPFAGRAGSRRAKVNAGQGRKAVSDAGATSITTTPGGAIGADGARVSGERGAAAVRPARDRLPEWSMPPWNIFLVKAALFSLVAVALQIFGVRISSSADNIYAQGRYLFPVMGFAAVLFVIGTKTAFNTLWTIGRAMLIVVGAAAVRKKGTPHKGGTIRKHVEGGEFALKVLIVIAVFVLTIVIWQYIVPVFHLTIASPHPGI